jgi:hypothetical protein
MIRSSAEIVDGNSHQFLAGREIQLLPGFKVGDTSELMIDIEDCPEPQNK